MLRKNSPWIDHTDLRDADSEAIQGAVLALFKVTSAQLCCLFSDMGGCGSRVSTVVYGESICGENVSMITPTYHGRLTMYTSHSMNVLGEDTDTVKAVSKGHDTPSVEIR